ncbi:MAG: tRNA 2-selenouridine(34) synthase MnmH [Betaproteobacteria bacterium]|nr:tRNA 2-selenouridine(34) synthase MnmH [Betaproteobacteria bacterium]
MNANVPARAAQGAKVGIEALAAHPDRIDVRSPSEFADDHIPGAVSLPVLDDAERAEVGTLHARESEFAAKQRGAAIVAHNIARIIERHCQGKPRDWAPLVYCWRGGKRSGALVHMLREIGWRAVQLEGGYRAYRRHVVAALESLPTRFRYVVICGLTGSGKSRLLAALADVGAQVLDLEGLARHRGSLLGDLPDDPQPSQKWFESQLLAALEGLDPALPVFVESESRKIGTVQLPEALLATMRASACVRVETPLPLRVALLKEEYAHFLADAEALAARLALLVPLHGHATVERWIAAARAGDFDALVGELLGRHYDPMYTRSIERNFPRIGEAHVAVPAGLAVDAFRALARAVVRAVGQPAPETVA